MSARRSGVLLKQGQKQQKWRSRYFELQGGRLVYFTDATKESQLASVVLSDVAVRFLSDDAFLPASAGAVSGFELVTPKRSYFLASYSEDDAVQWFDSILFYSL